MSNKDIIEIINDKNRIVVGKEINKKYLTDGLKRDFGEADILVFPISTKEVSDILKYANDNLIHVTPRGAGTGLVGATVPTERGIILDLSKMNNILNIDEENFTVTVEPGVLLRDVQLYVEERGLFYPPDPGEKKATIGGNISTNAGGMRAVKYGVTRDYVRMLEVVLADGTVLNLGSETIKNSSGLDLKDLFVGSEGTLGIITKAILKIIPKPKNSVSAIVPFKTLKDGINSVIKVIKENANPTAIEFIERRAINKAEDYLKIKFPCDKGNTFLLLTFDGDELEINSSYKKVEKVVIENGALDFILLEEEEDINRAWSIRGALVTAVEAVSEEEPIDIVVPINNIATFVEYTKEIEEKYGIEVVSFGHAGDGNVHLCVVRNGIEESEWKKKSHELLEELYMKSYELRGLPSGEHGVGLNKKEFFRKVTNEANILYMSKIKEAFDKNSILNANKVFR
ncbi:FAD-binding oxidoreductase [Clostridium paraputrificum]|uniref:FAD-binding oxidoreductase n=1 Tax=Clostridium TaxID=1485 RepID=UPI003D33EB63